jgi:GINS complex subunit 4
MHYLLLVAPPRASPTPSSLQSHAQTPEDSIPDPTDNSNPSPLSAQEAAFLHAHQTLLAGHYGASFLNSFPPQLRRLDDNAGGTSMVQGPEVREAVVVRCLVEEVRVVIPPGDGIEEEQFGTTMRMGDVWVVRWEGIKGAWERGEVEVL